MRVGTSLGGRLPHLCRVLPGLKPPWHEVVGDVLEVVQLAEGVQHRLVVPQNPQVAFGDSGREGLSEIDEMR